MEYYVYELEILVIIAAAAGSVSLILVWVMDVINSAMYSSAGIKDYGIMMLIGIAPSIVLGVYYAITRNISIVCAYISVISMGVVFLFLLGGANIMWYSPYVLLAGAGIMITRAANWIKE